MVEKSQRGALTAKLMVDAMDLINHKQLSQAVVVLEEVLEREPNNVEALFSLGFTKSNLGNYTEAKELLEKSLQINPKHAGAWNELGLLFAKNAHYEQAINALNKAISLEEGYIAYANLGDACAKMEKYSEAILAYENALRYNSSDPFVYGPLGFLYYKQGDYQKAFVNLQKSLQLYPRQQEFNVLLGQILYKFKKHMPSQMYYRRELEIDPNSAAACIALGGSLQRIGMASESVKYLKKGIACLKRPYPKLNEHYSFLLYVMNHDPDLTMQDFLQTAKEFYQDCFPEIAALPKQEFKYKHSKADFDPGKKIKIAYISKYFFRVTGERWILDLLEVRDRENFEVYIYHDNKTEDEITHAFRDTADYYRNVHDLSDMQLADKISDDGIDIMVDLLGHVTGNRLNAFVYKPAPVQVSWFGYFGTTGIPQMDYVFADAQVVKPGEDRDFVEKVYRLPHSYCYFRPPVLKVDIEEPPIKKNGYVTFGCFSRFNKVNEEVLDLWARLLHRVPNSKLLLKHEVLEEPELKNYLLDFFAKRGIEAQRLIFEAGDSFDEYFKAYNRIDIALDTFPYGGGTTTMHAMLMGVPVVSLEGDRWVFRGGGPLYYRLIGHPELVVQTKEDYIELAYQLSQDINRLDYYRANLKQKFLNSPVCNPYSYEKDLEDAFRNIWIEKSKNG